MNGRIYIPTDIDSARLIRKFSFDLSQDADLSYQLCYPTQASIPHTIGDAFRPLIAITVNLSTYSFPKADPQKVFLSDPSAFASAAPVAPVAAAGALLHKSSRRWKPLIAALTSSAVEVPRLNTFDAKYLCSACL